MNDTSSSTKTAGFGFVYECLLETLPAHVRGAWIQLSADAATEHFVRRAQNLRHRRPKYWLAAALRHIFSDFDVNGMLGIYPMHLLSTEQANLLLASAPRHSLLDIGAGNGDVTSQLAPLFAAVQTTEHSSAMARVLRRRGYACERVAIGDPLPEGAAALQKLFDLVTCFNVIDRTSHPARLLARAAARVSPQGALMLSVPLPLRPFYFEGPRTLDPEQRVELAGTTWEAQCSSLIEWLGHQLEGFQLERLARCPYLSGGDPGRSLYVLDDAILVLRRTGAVANDELDDRR